MFLNKITVYPNGSVVVLENGLIGIVMYQNPDNNRMPVIKVVADIDGNLFSAPYEVKLIASSDYIIKESWERIQFDEFIQQKQPKAGENL